MDVRVELSLDNMTWRDLFEFVAVAKRSGTSPDELVDFDIDERDMAKTGMYVYIDPASIDTGGV